MDYCKDSKELYRISCVCENLNGCSYHEFPKIKQIKIMFRFNWEQFKEFCENFFNISALQIKPYPNLFHLPIKLPKFGGKYLFEQENMLIIHDGLKQKCSIEQNAKILQNLKNFWYILEGSTFQLISKIKFSIASEDESEYKFYIVIFINMTDLGEELNRLRDALIEQIYNSARFDFTFGDY